MRGSLRAVAFAATVASGSGLGDAGAQTLTMAVGAPVTSLDPHYHQLSPNNAVAGMLFEQLTHNDAQAQLTPGLSVEWRAVAPDTWEFRLRPGVRFHNGSQFTADDVAFTLARVPNVPNSPSSFAIYTRTVRAIEIVDPLTIRMRTDGPYPLLPTDLANVRVLDRETHERATTEDFNAVRAAIGTGPYRAVLHRNGERIEFERNDVWWGERPHFQRVNYRMITNDAARTAALLAGDVEFIDQVPTTDIARLRNDPRVALSETVSHRNIFLILDHLREDSSPFVADNEGRPMARNPLKDVRVRRALSIAIDRNAIVERVMEGSALPSGQFMPSGTFGYVPELMPPRHDPEAARRLLAEAGFPQGFRITLHGPNDRYPNDARVVQAIGQMWTRVGVRTTVEALPWATFIGRAGRQEFSTALLGWGVSGGEASHPLRNLVATFSRETGFGPSNRGRYSNPRLDAVLAEALGELDDTRRERLLQDATRIAFDDVAIVPLHVQKNIWAMRRGLTHEPRADELTRAQDVRPAAAAAAR